MALHRRSAPPACRLLVATLALLCTGVIPVAPLGAQLEERPVTFDAAQRMTAITPMLADRLKLQAPAWPVTGAFREARLYAAGDGHVLVVQKSDGALVRYALDAAGTQALQDAVERGMRLAGNPAGEPNASVYSEVAGTRFARRQLLFGAILYGPLLASFANDGTSGSALYLTGAAMPSLMALGFARDGILTRSQTDLGVDATLRWALLGSFAHRAVAGDRDGDGHAATVLGASLAGTAAGLGLGRRLTDGEARGMVAGSNYTLGITAGLLGAMGAFEERCMVETQTGTNWNGTPYSYSYERCRSGTSKGEWGALLAAGVAGYPLGRAYARQRSYTVTGGDASALLVPAAIGAGLGAAIVGDEADGRTRWGAATGGLVLGLVAGDRLLVKPFDYTRSQATALSVGAVAGAIAGLIPATLAEADDGRAFAAGASIGAGLGAALAHAVTRPRRGMSGGVLREARLPRSRGGSLAPAAEVRSLPRVQWQLDPAGLAMAATRAPGRHGILSLTF